MKITFHPIAVKNFFDHFRTDTAITVESIAGGVLVTLINDDKHTASFELNNRSDYDKLASMLSLNSDKPSTRIPSINDGNFVLTASYTNLGEPFEEAIVFEVLLADSERFYDQRTLSAYLELDNRQSFLDEILAKL
ncbi:hypothetical protein FWP33_16950 [Vibrio parahaemolyticus]|nr:hypothetical protein [Vibrio parahaemolyticus]